MLYVDLSGVQMGLKSPLPCIFLLGHGGPIPPFSSQTAIKIEEQVLELKIRRICTDIQCDTTLICSRNGPDVFFKFSALFCNYWAKEGPSFMLIVILLV